MIRSTRTKDRSLLIFAIMLSLVLHMGALLVFHRQNLLFVRTRTSSPVSEGSQLLSQVFKQVTPTRAALSRGALPVPLAEQQLEIASFSASLDNKALVYETAFRFEDQQAAFLKELAAVCEEVDSGLTPRLLRVAEPLTVKKIEEVAQACLVETPLEVEGVSASPVIESVDWQAHIPLLGNGFSPQDRATVMASLLPLSAPYLQQPDLKIAAVEEGADVQQVRARPTWHALPSYGELNTTRCEEDFDLEVNFLPKEGEEGYIFAITLIPKPYIDFPRVRQNFHFVFNRSNDMGSKRFHATESAIFRSLAFLNEEDSFNIMAYDTTISSLAHDPVKVSKDSFAQAKRFLSKITLGNIFTNSDLLFPLRSIMASLKRSEDINVVILLTNGEGVAQVFNNGYVLNSWGAQNRGQCSLFALLMEEDKHLPLTELFTTFNRGKLLLTPTRTGIKRQLLKLVKSLKHPIAKDITITPISLQPGNKIELASSMRFPHLYLDDPYVIMGSIDKLDDFILFIQGRQNGRWLNIKKKISFVNAKTADRSLRRGWALYMACDSYQKYLKEQRGEYVKKMKELLTPYGIELPLP